MKEYVKQIYNEGLGLSLYKPLEKKLKKIKNSRLKSLLINIFKVLYFVFAICIAILLFLITYPL